MEPIVFQERPSLSRPPLICAFQGWNDGGQAATVATRYLLARWEAKPFAHLDPEEFYDFQVTRPHVRLEEGGSRAIDWPRGEFALARVQDRDVVIFTAAEPNVRWRTFADAIVAAAKDMGSDLLVTLGAFLTDVPHSRPVPVVGAATDERTAERLGLARSGYEGPTGIVGVLHDASNGSGLASISLWAGVPNYLPSAPNPKAALALVRRTCALLELTVDTQALERAADAWEVGVARLIRESEDLGDYVARLESAAERNTEGDDEGADAGSPFDSPVPTGEAIAAEVEEFLREQQSRGDSG